MKKLLYLLAAFIPGVAFAGLPEPVAGDKAIVALQAIFGKLFGGMTDALGTMNETYIGYVLMAAGAMAAYTIITGLMSTAHYGEMMGKTYSSLWIPVKYAIGVALIIPINNWCTGQYIVADLIKTSIGGGDAVWSSFMSSSNLKEIAKVTIDVPNVRDLTYKIFASQVCVAAIQVKEGEKDEVLRHKNSSYGTSVEDGVINKIVKFGDTTGSAYATDECGRVEVRKVQFPDTPPVGDMINPIAYNLKVEQQTARMKAIADQHWTQVNALIEKTKAIAEKVASDTRVKDGSGGYRTDVDVAAINGQLEAASKAYRDAIYDTASAYTLGDEAFKPLQESATKDGFIMAGAWPIAIYGFQEHTQKTIANLPQASGPTLNSIGDNLGELRERFYKVMANSASAQVNWGVAETSGGSKEGWTDTFTKFFKNGMDPNVIAKKAFSSITDLTVVGDQNMLLQDKRIGNWLLTIAGVSWVAGAGISAIPVIGSFIANSIQGLMQYMIAIGIFLAYILPMLPFLMWFGAIFGWLVSLIEAIFVVPAWIAITFLDPHGDSFVGSSGQGYKLILQLMLRPVFMVFGLVASIMMIDVVGKFINQIFAQVFLISQSDSSFISFIVGAGIGFPLMYGAISVVVVVKSTSLCSLLADQMLNWLVNGAASLTGHSDDMAGRGSVAANASMGTAVGTALANRAGPSANFKEPGNAGAMSKFSTSSKFAGSELKEGKTEKSDLAKVLADKVGKNPTANQSALTERMNNMKSFLGEGSQAKFEKEMVKSINKNDNFSDTKHMDEAFKVALNNEYGAGAGAMIKSAGGGNFNSEGAQQMAGLYQKAKADYQAANPYARESDFLESMSSVTAQAKNQFMGSGESTLHKEDGKGLDYFMNESLKSNMNNYMNQDIDTSLIQKPVEQAVDSSPSGEAPRVVDNPLPEIKPDDGNIQG